MNKKLLVLMAVLMVSAGLKAQEDFGVWTTVEAKTKILPGLDAFVEGDFRTMDGVGTIERWSGAAGLTYKVWSFLKVGGDYTYLRFNHEKRGWETGHRYNLFATGSVKWNRFEFSLRERYQHTYREGVKETKKRANPKDILRSRLQIEYDIHKTRFKPFVSAELFHTLNDPQGNGLDKARFTAGTEYKINKKNSLELYYRYQTSQDEDELDRHVLGVGYSVRF